MKVLWMMLAFVALWGVTPAQAQTANSPEPPVSVSEVAWGDHAAIKLERSYSEYVRRNFRTMSVTVTNEGSLPIESVRLAFVFSDPDTGEEWFRYKAHSKKRLLPGESRSIVKSVTATMSMAGVPRDEQAAKSAVVTEVKYSDGSVWRLQ